MTTLTEIKLNNLKSFENNPFIFREDTAFEMLIDSISNLGVLTPIIVRSIDKATARTKEVAVMYEKLFEKHINGVVNEESFMQLS